MKERVKIECASLFLFYSVLFLLFRSFSNDILSVSPLGCHSQGIEERMKEGRKMSRNQ